MESAYSNDDLKGNEYLFKVLAEFTWHNMLYRENLVEKSFDLC